MNVYTCNKFKGFHLSAVVVADNKADAARMLNETLVSMGLTGDVTGARMDPVAIDNGNVVILFDVDY